MSIQVDKNQTSTSVSVLFLDVLIHGNENRLFLLIPIIYREIVLHTQKTGYLKLVIMPFKYTDGKENSLYAWRAFLYGKKIEIFC